MSRLWRVDIIFVVVILIHVLSAVINFDCRRSGAECIDTGAKCNQTSGKCSCTDDLNYKCQTYVNRTGSATACVPPCVHGMCDGIKKKCLCEAEYYGSTCEINRVVVFCTDKEMYIGINPIVKNFGGMIYELDNEKCLLNNLHPDLIKQYHLSNETVGYNRIISHSNNNDCKNLAVSPNTDTTYNRTFYIQYSQYFKSSADQIIRTQCKVYGDTDTVHSSYTVQWSERNIQDETITKDKKPQLDLYILDENDQEITNVILGARIKLKFLLKLDENTDYNDFSVTKCKAFRTDVQSLNLTLLDSGCLQTATLVLFYGDLQEQFNRTSVTKDLFLKAFQFAAPDTRPQNVEFECTVTFCTGSCTKPSCPTTVSRKRRSVNPDSEKQISTVVTVLDPMTRINELQDKLQAEVNQKYESPDCLQQPSFIAVIATMGGVLLILLVLCIVVTVRLIKANKKKSGDWQHQLTNLPRPSFAPSSR